MHIRTLSDRAPIRHIDPVLIAATVLLTVVGMFAIYSATHGVGAGGDPWAFVRKQIIAFVVAAVLLGGIALFDYRLAKVYAPILYAGTLLVLLMVRLFGQATKGAQRGFYLGGFQFTPSELSKVALAVMLAAFLSELKPSELSLRDLVRASALAIVPMFLVFIQPDIGTTIVLAAILGGVLVVSGARARYLGVLAASAVLLIALTFQIGLIKQYQIDRLTCFAGGCSSSQTTYNREQSEIAIGSGGAWGTGYLKGTQTNLNFVPEQHTEFIFTVIGEEFGFVGAAALLFLYALLLWRAIRIAMVSKDKFGTYLAAGIASMFAIQMFVNIGMTVGIMPITGIPLPFVSYGGSSLIANYVAVGLLLNIHMRRLTVGAMG
jgi:rod shape determining protein RodA